MGDIEDLRAFVHIVEQGSIGKAAEQTGVAKSAMSRKLRLLEERMQTELITRTSRQWSLTEAGREYYDRGVGLINAFDEFEASVRNENMAVRGDVRLSVPLYFGKVSLTPHLLQFASKHPDVHLNIDFSDRLVDVINENFDLVIRISDLPDSSFIARKLCETRHIYCASPDYLSNSTPINEPNDIRNHRIIQFGSAKRPKWSFTSASGKTTTVSLSASMNSHDGEFLIDAAECGLGIVRVPDFLARTSLDNGRLIQILKPFDLKPRGIYIVYPSARYLPQQTRVLMEFLLSGVGDSC